ncbi:MAG: HTH-type transcriptional regulator Ptr2 [Methanomassiliicoccales archaeon PtaB.Bin134]|jgi:DNA-binding Lrp family transcriptional regulator|nr:MAG: HTH-type transcriptional regulator Ptr2 [Methanomassiliicoccales archaeon PtaB.Bin134]
MDLIDLEVLRMLRKNAREGLGVIADQLGVSKATVSRRISRLEEAGYVNAYTMQVNTAKIGLMRALIGLQVVGSPLTAVIDELKKFPGIQYVYKVFGDHSLICEVYSTSVDSLYDLIQDKIVNIPSVQRVEVDILIERIPINEDAMFDLALPMAESDDSH